MSLPPEHQDTSPPVPDRRLRVAAAQAVAEPGELARNAATAARLVAATAGDGIRLLVLPELFLPAYHPPTLGAEPSRCDVSADADGMVTDPRLDALRTAVATHHTAVLVGASVRAVDGARYLAALLVDGAGTARDVYHKRHLVRPDEADLFTPGTEAATLSVDGWLLGVGICYDGCFPEHARSAALAGAHAYVCPAAYTIGGEHRRDLYYPARALDNTMYVVFANAVGGPDPWRFNGSSTVYDPEGRVLARAPGDEEAAVAVDLDPALLAQVRGEQPFLTDVGTGEPDHRRLLTVSP